MARECFQGFIRKELAGICIDRYMASQPGNRILFPYGCYIWLKGSSQSESLQLAKASINFNYE